jgi:hypothetical protein
METNKGIAASIIDEGEEETELSSIDEEFDGYAANLEEMKETLRKRATKLRASGKTPASKEDLAALYDLLVGEVLDLFGDVTKSTGETLSQLVEFTEDVAGEEDEDEDDEENTEEDSPEIGDDTVQVYTTLLANAEAMRKIGAVEALPPEYKTTCEGLVKMNEAAMALLEGEFSPEVLRDRAKKLMEQAASAV